jgi:hypothetical protein
VRYRRLGQTELMVSEVGLEVRPLLAQGAEAAEQALRGALAAGVTVFTWDVSDATEDVEPIIARAAGVDRGRLTLIATLDFVPPPAAIGPQVEAIATRLEVGVEGEEGYVDVIALPGLPDEAQLRALEEVRRRGIVRFVAVAADSDAALPAALPSAVDVLVLGGAPVSDRDSVGVVARVAPEVAPVLRAGGAVSCVVTSAPSAADLARIALG